MASPVYIGGGQQLPTFKAVINETTTLSYGWSVVYNTNTLYDAAAIPPMSFGRGVVLATTTVGGAFPAGVVWGYTSSGFVTDTSIAADEPFFVVEDGMHPQAAIWGTATYADLVYVAGVNSGTLYASNTSSISLTCFGRALSGAVATVTQTLPVWVRRGVV